MSSIREQAIGAIVAALNTSTPEGMPTARRERLSPYGPGALPGLNVVIPDLGGRAQEAVEQKAGTRGLVQRSLAIGVECYASGSGTQALDSLLCWASQALAGSTLGGLVVRVDETGTAWESASAERDFWKATALFRVLYLTRVADQESKAA